MLKEALESTLINSVLKGYLFVAESWRLKMLLTETGRQNTVRGKVDTLITANTDFR